MSGKLINPAPITVNTTIEINYLGGGGDITWVGTIGTGTVAVDQSPNKGVDYIEDTAAANALGRKVPEAGIVGKRYKFTIVAVATTINFYASGNWDVKNAVIT